MGKDNFIEFKKDNNKVDIYFKLGDTDIPYLWNADKDCEHEIESASGGGVKCTKCSGWCCF